MKGIAVKASLTVVAIALAIVGIAKARADESEETPIIYIELAPTPKPEKAKHFTFSPNHYDWDAKTLDAVASIYWANTGYGSEAAVQKLALTQLIWNRVQYYKVHEDKYAGTIYEVCRQKGEFNRGKVSDKNRKLAQEYLDMVRSQDEGIYCGITVPRDALKMAWDEATKEMYFLDLSNNEVWRCEKQ
jgi:hypothetical protein